MASKTEFLELIKPLAEEFYDIAILNGNMDIIDDAIEGLQNIKADQSLVNGINNNLTTLTNTVNSHLDQTTYQKYVGSLKDIDYTCNVYADGDTTDRPGDSSVWYVDVLVRPELKNTHRILIARNSLSDDVRMLQMVAGVWGEWTDAYASLKQLINAKYTKPTNGIPKTDLVSAVQTSLNKADSALQLPQTTEWQRYKLTTDSGTVVYPTGYTRTRDLPYGSYYITGANAANFTDLPMGNPSCYVEVIKAADDNRIIRVTIGVSPYAVFEKVIATGVDDGWQIKPKILLGDTAPEGVKIAPTGTFYRNTSNGDLYYKKTGGGNAGWKLVTLT